MVHYLFPAIIHSLSSIVHVHVHSSLVDGDTNISYFTGMPWMLMYPGVEVFVNCRTCDVILCRMSFPAIFDLIFIPLRFAYYIKHLWAEFCWYISRLVSLVCSFSSHVHTHWPNNRLPQAAHGGDVVRVEGRQHATSHSEASTASKR